MFFNDLLELCTSGAELRDKHNNIINWHNENGENYFSVYSDCHRWTETEISNAKVLSFSAKSSTNIAFVLDLDGYAD